MHLWFREGSTEPLINYFDRREVGKGNHDVQGVEVLNTLWCGLLHHRDISDWAWYILRVCEHGRREKFWANTIFCLLIGRGRAPAVPAFALRMAFDWFVATLPLRVTGPFALAGVPPFISSLSRFVPLLSKSARYGFAAGTMGVIGPVVRAFTTLADSDLTGVAIFPGAANTDLVELGIGTVDLGRGTVEPGLETVVAEQ
jgi:hypothetical protein